MARFAFEALRVARILATTEYANPRSLAVMQRLGMRLESNPRANPPWLQHVGTLERENP